MNFELNVQDKFFELVLCDRVLQSMAIKKLWRG